MSQHLIDSWRRSIICLSYQIHQLSLTNNLLGESAAERNEFFFSDFGVPMPRPCTGLAWASLCSLGPVQQMVTPDGNNLDLTNSRFFIPFLPKIRYGEETNQSLIRTSRAHVRDSDDNIRWGSVYLCDSSDPISCIDEQLQHGAFNPKEWMDSHSTSNALRLGMASDSFPPTLYSYVNEGWQFGVIQSIPTIAVTLRDQMVELARHGIPELEYLRGVPKIRRLLIRFLDVQAARAWGKAYSLMLADCTNPDRIKEDALELAVEIQEAQQQRFQDAAEAARSKKATKKRQELDLSDLPIDPRIKPSEISTGDIDI